MTMRLLRSVAVTCVLFWLALGGGVARGEEQTLIEKIPPNLDSVIAVMAVRDALVYRGWTITKATDDQVVGWLKQGKDEYLFTARPGPGGRVFYSMLDADGQNASPNGRPGSFVRFIRDDVEIALRTVSLSVFAASRAPR